MSEIEIVPAILRTTFEKIEEDWNKVVRIANYIQIDVTDGVFAGDESFMDIPRLADLSDSHKIELHMMVQTPADYVEDIIELNPGRCIFHLESFLGNLDLPFVYNTVGEYTSSEMGIAINPDTDISRLTEYLPLIQYVLFLGVTPGFSGQAISPHIFEKISDFHAKNPHIKISVDGHIDKTTIEKYAKAGATIFCANSAIFKEGNPEENIKQLALLASAL
jgi:ribulose-phosphate 3-epimerase